MTDLQRAYLSHSAPGRARLKIPDRRKDVRFFTEAAERMLGAPGVERVEANPLTGSLLLVHSGELGPILEFAREQGLFALADPETMPPPIARRLYGEIQAMSRALRRTTGGQIDLNMTVFMLFVAASVVQFVRGQVFGPSSTLLWYASTLLAARAAAGSATDRGDDGG